MWKKSCLVGMLFKRVQCIASRNMNNWGNELKEVKAACENILREQTTLREKSTTCDKGNTV